MWERTERGLREPEVNDVFERVAYLGVGDFYITNYHRRFPIEAFNPGAALVGEEGTEHDARVVLSSKRPGLRQILSLPPPPRALVMAAGEEYKRGPPTPSTMKMSWPSAYGRVRLIKDEKPLGLDYVPERLPHREEQLAQLTSIFTSALKAGMARRVLITGKIGTGKTVTAKKFGQLIEEIARRMGLELHYVHVNCRLQNGSFFHILLEAMRRLRPDFPERGYATNELLTLLLRELDDRDAYMIITLDDAEALIDKSGSRPFFALSRAHEAKVGGPFRLSLICVLREPEKLKELDDATRSTLEEYAIHMPEYSKEQLFDILMDRVKLAFVEGAIREEVVAFIAELAASEGNARYAIELLWRAGRLAEQEGRYEVLPEHVRKAKVMVWPVERMVLKALSIHEKLFLLALSRLFKFTDEAKVTMGEAKEEYKVLCEEFSQEPRKHTQIWKYVQRLAELSLITAEPSGPGRRGRTTLIGLLVPAEELEEELTGLLSKELGIEVD